MGYSGIVLQLVIAIGHFHCLGLVSRTVPVCRHITRGNAGRPTARVTSVEWWVLTLATIDNRLAKFNVVGRKSDQWTLHESMQSTKFIVVVLRLNVATARNIDFVPFRHGGTGGNRRLVLFFYGLLHLSALLSYFIATLLPCWTCNDRWIYFFFHGFTLFQLFRNSWEKKWHSKGGFFFER